MIFQLKINWNYLNLNTPLYLIIRLTLTIIIRQYTNKQHINIPSSNQQKRNKDENFHRASEGNPATRTPAQVLRPFRVVHQTHLVPLFLYSFLSPVCMSDPAAPPPSNPPADAPAGEEPKKLSKKY